jgi:hypothetical protein
MDLTRIRIPVFFLRRAKGALLRGAVLVEDAKKASGEPCRISKVGLHQTRQWLIRFALFVGFQD